MEKCILGCCIACVEYGCDRDDVCNVIVVTNSSHSLEGHDAR